MRKTRAGRILLGITNMAILTFLLTAVYSAVPPAYNAGISSASITVTPSDQMVSITYSVSNNGFYDIDNFYVRLTANLLNGTYVNGTQSIPVLIPRGSSKVGTINLNISQSYIALHHGDYVFTLTINSEFAYGLIKFSVQNQQVHTF